MARGIYPLLDVVVERAEQPFVNAALKDTDRRVGEGKPVAPSFLLACVLWADVRDGWEARQNERQNALPALHDAIDDAFNARIGDVSGRGRLAGDMREIWVMQPRFEKRVGSAPFGLVDQPRFRAAFDFMRLRSEIGEVDETLADWWQEFSMADDNLRQDMVDQVREEQQKRPRMVRAPRPAIAAAPQNTTDTASDNAPGDEANERPLEGSADAPKKRRRRRRSGASRDVGTGESGGQNNDGAREP
jgi:poly(A) polymerase